MKKIVCLFTVRMAIAASAAALTFLFAGSAKAQFNGVYYFEGATSSSFSDATNYYASDGPTQGVTNSGSLAIQDSGLNRLVYTSANGSTTFTGGYESGDFLNVDYNTVGGTASVTGGTLTFESASDLGGNTNTNSALTDSLTVSGGTVNFEGTNTYDATNASLQLGTNGFGTVNLSGGAINVTNGLDIDFYGSGTGRVNVSGGTFDVEGLLGTALGTGSGTGIINISAGTFEETGSNILSFGTTTSYINLSGTGVISLLGETAAQYDALITAGDFDINGTKDTTVTDYNYSLVGGQGVLAAPEPSTWALMLGGFGVLALVQRRRSLDA